MSQKEEKAKGSPSPNPGLAFDPAHLLGMHSMAAGLPYAQLSPFASPYSLLGQPPHFPAAAMFGGMNLNPMANPLHAAALSHSLAAASLYGLPKQSNDLGSPPPPSLLPSTPSSSSSSSTKRSKSSKSASSYAPPSSSPSPSIQLNHHSSHSTAASAPSFSPFDSAAAAAMSPYLPGWALNGSAYHMTQLANQMAEAHKHSQSSSESHHKGLSSSSLLLSQPRSSPSPSSSSTSNNRSSKSSRNNKSDISSYNSKKVPATAHHHHHHHHHNSRNSHSSSPSPHHSSSKLNIPSSISSSSSSSSSALKKSSSSSSSSSKNPYGESLAGFDPRSMITPYQLSPELAYLSQSLLLHRPDLAALSAPFLAGSAFPSSASTAAAAEGGVDLGQMSSSMPSSSSSSSSSHRKKHEGNFHESDRHSKEKSKSEDRKSSASTNGVKTSDSRKEVNGSSSKHRSQSELQSPSNNVTADIPFDLSQSSDHSMDNIRKKKIADQIRKRMSTGAQQDQEDQHQKQHEQQKGGVETSDSELALLTNQHGLKQSDWLDYLANERSRLGRGRKNSSSSSVSASSQGRESQKEDRLDRWGLSSGMSLEASLRQQEEELKELQKKYAMASAGLQDGPDAQGRSSSASRLDGEGSQSEKESARNDDSNSGSDSEGSGSESHKRSQDNSDSASSPVKKRCYQTDERELVIPLEHGWNRQTVINGMGRRGIVGDVYYFAPCGKKLKTIPDVMRYMDRNPNDDLGRENFSFNTKVNVGQFYEIRGGASSTPIPLTDTEVLERIEMSRGKRARMQMLARKKREKAAREQALARQIMENKLKRKLELQEMSRRAAELRFEKKLDKQKQKETERKLREDKAVEKQKEKEQFRLVKQQERIRLQEQIRKEREMRAQQIIEARNRRQQELEEIRLADTAKRNQERELKRQQLIICKEQERERRRQHILLIKALEQRKKQEERMQKERLREEKLNEKLKLKEIRMSQRKVELEVAQELKKPVEDMELKNGKLLPELPRMESRMAGQPIADCLMVVEFLNNFGSALNLEKSSLPTLQSLENGLMGDSEEEVEEVMSLVMHLLRFALDDVGVPNPKEAVTKLNQRITEIEMTDSTMSEILRIFIKARGDEKMSEYLREKPMESLNPTQKASILAFICNELLTSRVITGEIDKHMESINNLRRDKWIVEGQLRQLRVFQAKKFNKIHRSTMDRRHTNSGNHKSGSDGVLGCAAGGGGGDDDSVPSSKIGGSDDEDKDDDDDDGSGNESDSSVSAPLTSAIPTTNMPFEPVDENLTREESDKRIEHLRKQHLAYRQKVFRSSLRLRAINIGQDRYKRTYWILPITGGVYVEGMESGEPQDYKEESERKIKEEVKEEDDQRNEEVKEEVKEEENEEDVKEEKEDEGKEEKNKEEKMEVEGEENVLVVDEVEMECRSKGDGQEVGKDDGKEGKDVESVNLVRDAVGDAENENMLKEKGEMSPHSLERDGCISHSTPNKDDNDGMEELSNAAIDGDDEEDDMNDSFSNVNDNDDEEEGDDNEMSNITGMSENASWTDSDFNDSDVNTSFSGLKTSVASVQLDLKTAVEMNDSEEANDESKIVSENRLLPLIEKSSRVREEKDDGVVTSFEAAEHNASISAISNIENIEMKTNGDENERLCDEDDDVSVKDTSVLDMSEKDIQVLDMSEKESRPLQQLNPVLNRKGLNIHPEVVDCSEVSDKPTDVILNENDNFKSIDDNVNGERNDCCADDLTIAKSSDSDCVAKPASVGIHNGHLEKMDQSSLETVEGSNLSDKTGTIGKLSVDMTSDTIEIEKDRMNVGEDKCEGVTTPICVDLRTGPDVPDKGLSSSVLDKLPVTDILRVPRIGQRDLSSSTSSSSLFSMLNDGVPNAHSNKQIEVDLSASKKAFAEKENDKISPKSRPTASSILSSSLLFSPLPLSPPSSSSSASLTTPDLLKRASSNQQKTDLKLSTSPALPSRSSSTKKFKDVNAVNLSGQSLPELVPRPAHSKLVNRQTLPPFHPSAQINPCLGQPPPAAHSSKIKSQQPLHLSMKDLNHPTIKQSHSHSHPLTPPTSFSNLSQPLGLYGDSSSASQALSSLASFISPPPAHQNHSQSSAASSTLLTSTPKALTSTTTATSTTSAITATASTKFKPPPPFSIIDAVLKKEPEYSSSQLLHHAASQVRRSGDKDSMPSPISSSSTPLSSTSLSSPMKLHPSSSSSGLPAVSSEFSSLISSLSATPSPTSATMSNSDNHQDMWFSLLPRIPCDEQSLTGRTANSLSPSSAASAAASQLSLSATASLLLNSSATSSSAIINSLINSSTSTANLESLLTLLQSNIPLGNQDNFRQSFNFLSSSPSLSPTPSSGGEAGCDFKVPQPPLDSCALNYDPWDLLRAAQGEKKPIPINKRHGWWRIFDLGQMKKTLTSTMNRGIRERNLQRAVHRYMDYTKLHTTHDSSQGQVDPNADTNSKDNNLKRKATQDKSPSCSPAKKEKKVPEKEEKDDAEEKSNQKDASSSSSSSSSLCVSMDSKNEEINGAEQKAGEDVDEDVEKKVDASGEATKEKDEKEEKDPKMDTSSQSEDVMMNDNNNDDVEEEEEEKEKEINVSVKNEGEEIDEDTDQQQQNGKEEMADEMDFVQPDSDDLWSVPVMHEIEISALDDVETLEDRIYHASLQAKSGWKPNKETGLKMVDRTVTEVKDDESYPLDAGISRLLELEANIERRYIKPPLSRSVSLNMSNMASSSQTIDRQDSSNTTDLEEEEDIPPGLLLWRQAVIGSESPAQLSLCTQLLTKSISWEKSIMRVICQNCRKDDNEAELLLCDGCDKGFHTYCFKPKMENIPEGDWYCFECVTKASGTPHCGLCGNKGGRLAHCSKCPRYIHLDCLDPPLPRIPKRWQCANCLCDKVVSKRSRKRKESLPTIQRITKLVVKEEPTDPDDLNGGVNTPTVTPPSSVKDESKPSSLADNSSPHKSDLNVSLSSSSPVTDIHNASANSGAPEKKRRKRKDKQVVESKPQLSSPSLPPSTSTPADTPKKKEKKPRKERKTKVTEKKEEMEVVQSKDKEMAVVLRTVVPQWNGEEEKEDCLVLCGNVLGELEEHELGWPFLKPVNRKQFPSYKKYIKTPMDFTTIRNRLKSKSYKHRQEFAVDVRLVFNNCETFNEDESEVGQAGHQLRQFFEHRWLNTFPEDAS